MQIEPLAQGFGAEVCGFDAQCGCRAGDIEALRTAYDQWHLLVFRDCGRLAPERQVDITGWFGPVGANQDDQGRPWTVLHNDHATGSAVLPFHCDISFMAHPLEGISLHPLALPNVDTSTTFVSNEVGWQSLTSEMQDELRGLRARHYYASSADMDMDWPVFETWHPVCLTHPKTGRPLLFVTEHHVDRIDGVSEARSAQLLEILFVTLYAAQRRYEHVWRVGDLVIWDNLAVQHARTQASAPCDGARALQRVAIGEHGFVDQLHQLLQERAGMATRA